MPENPIQLPNDAELARERGDLVAQVEALAITCQPEYELAASFLGWIKALLARVGETFDPICQAADRAHKLAVAKRREHAEPLQRAELRVKAMMSRYVDAENRRIRDEAARLEREAREEEARRRAAEREAEEAARLAEAEALAAAGMHAEADAVLDAPMPEPDPIPPPPPPPTIARPTAAGISVRETWSGEVTDLAALVRAIADGRAPLTLVKADPVALGAWARSTKGTVAIPGVRVASGTGIAARAS